jgi:hypothetical protein
MAPHLHAMQAVGDGAVEMEGRRTGHNEKP